MKTKKIEEHGYDSAVLGFSLSYNTSIERTMQILPKYAFGKSGENKFLESIQLWIDITAPRYFWQEFDTYRAGVSKQSASTMHTITKRNLTQDDFEDTIQQEYLEYMNGWIEEYRTTPNKDQKKALFLMIKNNLPEGFLQERIVNINYKTFRHMYEQRIDHRLPEWKMFLNYMMENIEHPEFIIKDYEDFVKVNP